MQYIWALWREIKCDIRSGHLVDRKNLGLGVRRPGFNPSCHSVALSGGELCNLYESYLPICKIRGIKLCDFNKVFRTLVLYNQLRGPCLLQLFIGWILKNRKKSLL